MARPKLENGYTRVSNELLEAIILSDFTAAEYKILFAVIRQTYGFQRKSAAISMMQFSRMCGLHFTSVSRAIKRMIENKILIEKSKPGFAKCREVEINKNHAQWLVKRLTVSINETVSADANPLVSVHANETVSADANHTKERYKKNIKKRERCPSLELINDFSTQNGLDLNVAEKFFKYYESRDWKTNGGTDVTAIWRDKLTEWNKNEIKKNKDRGYGSYNKVLVEKLLNSD